MERHILYKMINEGYNLELREEQFTLLSIEFIQQYHLIKEMMALGIPIDKNQLSLYALIERKNINVDYAQENKGLKDETFEEAFELYLTQQDQQREIRDVRDIINNIKTNDTKSIEKAQDKLSNILVKSADNVKIRDLKDVAKGQRDFMDEIFSGKENDGLYLYSVNKKTSRQFMKLSYKLKYIANTDLVIIGGRPSVGKTSFVLSLMNVLAKNNYRGLYFSLEMTGEQNLHRMALAKSNISNDKIFGFQRTPSGEFTEDYQQLIVDYTRGLHAIAELPIDIIDDPINSWLEIKNTIIKNKDNYDYVVIDHLTYIPSFDGNANRNNHEMYSMIVRDIKQTAKKYEIPILLLGQLSRGASSGKRGDLRYTEPYAHDFRETGSIEEYADKILMLYRKRADEQEAYNVYRIACKVEKNRAGQTGVVDYWFYASKNRWRETEDNE